MKQHPTIPYLYVAQDGRVFRELTPSIDGGGYAQIRNGEVRMRRSVIVCETFHGPRPEGHVVRHRDGNPENDLPENLEWGTQAENMQDAVVHGTTTRGSRNARAKLTEAQVAEIKARLDHREKASVIAADYCVSTAAIIDIRKGATWAHVEKKWGLA